MKKILLNKWFIYAVALVYSMGILILAHHMGEAPSVPTNILEA